MERKLWLFTKFKVFHHGNGDETNIELSKSVNKYFGSKTQFTVAKVRLFIDTSIDSIDSFDSSTQLSGLSTYSMAENVAEQVIRPFPREIKSIE